jgi:drug/metabolite transporter (DMT)-like permease
MDEATQVTTRRRWIGVLALVGCAMLWSLNGPLIKLLDQAEVPGITIACYRSLLGGLIFLPLALRRRKSLRNATIGWQIGSVLTFTLMTASFVIATTRTAAANAIILQYTAPIWVFLLSPLLLRERLHLTDGLVLVLAMAGVGIIFLGHTTSDIPALSIGLASGLGYGSLIVMLRGLRRVDPSMVVALNFVGSGVLLLPAVAIWGVFLLNSYQYALVLALSLVQMALPYLVFSWALQYVEAHRASLIVLLETVLNPIWTYLVVGEMVPTATLVGGPLILLAVAGWMLVTWRHERASPAPEGVPTPSEHRG